MTFNLKRLFFSGTKPYYDENKNSLQISDPFMIFELKKMNLIPDCTDTAECHFRCLLVDHSRIRQMADQQRKIRPGQVTFNIFFLKRLLFILK